MELFDENAIKLAKTLDSIYNYYVENPLEQDKILSDNSYSDLRSTIMSRVDKNDPESLKKILLNILMNI